MSTSSTNKLLECLADALQSQMAATILLLSKYGYSQQDIEDATSQAREALDRLAATPKAGVSVADDSLAKSVTTAALTALKAGGDNLAVFNAVKQALTLPSVLGGVDQQETQTTKPSPSSTSATATETAIDALEQNCWDLRCVDIPTGAGDADIGWQIVEHHMAPPKERVVGYGNSPLEALNEALAGGRS